MTRARLLLKNARSCWCVPHHMLVRPGSLNFLHGTLERAPNVPLLRSTLFRHICVYSGLFAFICVRFGTPKPSPQWNVGQNIRKYPRTYANMSESSEKPNCLSVPAIEGTVRKPRRCAGLCSTSLSGLTEPVGQVTAVRCPRPPRRTAPPTQPRQVTAVRCPRPPGRTKAQTKKSPAEAGPNTVETLHVTSGRLRPEALRPFGSSAPPAPWGP